MKNKSRFTLTKIAGVAVAGAIAGGALFASIGASAQTALTSLGAGSMIGDLAQLNTLNDSDLTKKMNELALKVLRTELRDRMIRESGPGKVGGLTLAEIDKMIDDMPNKLLIWNYGGNRSQRYIDLVVKGFNEVRASGRTTYSGSTSASIGVIGHGDYVTIVAGANAGTIESTQGREVLIDPSLTTRPDANALLNANKVNNKVATLLVNGSSAFVGDVRVTGKLQAGTITDVEAAIKGKQNQLTAAQLAALNKITPKSAQTVSGPVSASVPIIEADQFFPVPTGGFGDHWNTEKHELSNLNFLTDQALSVKLSALAVERLRADRVTTLVRTGATLEAASNAVSNLTDQEIIWDIGDGGQRFRTMVQQGFNEVRATGRTVVSGSSTTTLATYGTVVNIVGGATQGTIESTMGREVLIDPSLTTRPDANALLNANKVNNKVATLLVNGAAAFTGDVRINGKLNLGSMVDVASVINNKQNKLTAAQMAVLNSRPRGVAETIVPTSPVQTTSAVTEPVEPVAPVSADLNVGGDLTVDGKLVLAGVHGDVASALKTVVGDVNQQARALQNQTEAIQLLGTSIKEGTNVANIDGVLTVGKNAVQIISADAADDGKDRVTTDGRGNDGKLHLGGGAAKVDVVVDGSLTVAKDLTVGGNLFVQGRGQDVASTLNKVETATNVGAAAVLNVIALELTPESLRSEGVAFNATVGSNEGGSEVRLGVSKALGDTGAVASVGVGTESGRVGASIGKSIDVTENIKAGVSASVDSSGFNIGPSVTLHKGGYGIGASTFGPTVMINGVTLPVAGPMAMPNLVVTGMVGAYQAITGKTKAEIAGLKVRAEKAEAGNSQLKAEMETLKAQMAAILKAQTAK